MPGRQANPGDYRYGFNGKELDDNGSGMGGGGSTYDYGFRIYNPQIAKFLSVDPLAKEYPWYTPYQFAGNSPIWAIDLDGLEEADPQQIKAAEQYYNKTKLTQSEVFPNITPLQINAQVHQRLKNLGKSIYQGKFFLCGPAAAAYLAASHDPLAYVKTVFDLYMKGFANGKAIEGNDAIYNAVPDANGKIDGIPIVDWILLNSLRYSENAIDYGSYDPHKTGDDVNKMTLKNEFTDLVERLDADVSFPVSNSSISSKDDLATLSDWSSSGKMAVLFINSLAYRGQGAEGVEGWVSENYGRHFVVLKAITFDKTGTVSVSYWDYGKTVLTTKTFDSFEAFKEATMDYWLIVNEGQQNNE